MEKLYVRRLDKNDVVDFRVKLLNLIVNSDCIWLKLNLNNLLFFNFSLPFSIKRSTNLGAKDIWNYIMSSEKIGRGCIGTRAIRRNLLKITQIMTLLKMMMKISILTGLLAFICSTIALLVYVVLSICLKKI